ncbi:hypothetical protein CBR_g2957 [Chara braunii]|uniref:Shikimate kinase n=1 Tax=Chara braunii TaxID=69332 RepID=A0A388KEN3_CHABU|nr:hypothetical protein CBR_g2957 [Chara braunii]|eukprot:GBG68413.1 hypothetical protein CBR_g2957 [Chara braunii]
MAAAAFATGTQLLLPSAAAVTWTGVSTNDVSPSRCATSGHHNFSCLFATCHRPAERQEWREGWRSPPRGRRRLPALLPDTGFDIPCSGVAHVAAKSVTSAVSVMCWALPGYATWNARPPMSGAPAPRGAGIPTTITAVQTNADAPLASASACAHPSAETAEDVVAVLIKQEADAVVASLKGSSIYLIGMMGSGKSTVGPILADALGYYFFDVDDLVQEAAGGIPVSEIVAQHGIEEFRDAESDTLKELAGLARCVVSTGAGAVIRQMNWGYLQYGVVIFLTAPLDVLADRVVRAGVSSRPVLVANMQGGGGGGGGEEEGHVDMESEKEKQFKQAMSALGKIYEERKDKFAMADATVSVAEVALQAGVEATDVSPGMLALQALRELRRLVQERKDKEAEMLENNINGY